MKKSIFIIPIALALALGACTSETPTPVKTPAVSVSIPALPEVEGVNVKEGATPTISFEAKTPSTQLSRTVLREGTGPQVTKGDLFAAYYTGQVYNGDVFDGNFTADAPASFPLGVGAVIKGWDEGLVGMRAGSRVLLSIPAEQGYGDTAAGDGKIPANSTLVFVIDVVSVYSSTQRPNGSAIDEDSVPEGITVESDLSKEASVSISDAAPLPEDKVIVLSKGKGEDIVSGTVAVNYAATNYAGDQSTSSYTDTPTYFSVGTTGTVFDDLVGVPQGSRVLVLLAATSTTDEPRQTATAIVVDVLGQLDKTPGA